MFIKMINHNDLVTFIITGLLYRSNLTPFHNLFVKLMTVCHHIVVILCVLMSSKVDVA